MIGGRPQLTRPKFGLVDLAILLPLGLTVAWLGYWLIFKYNYNWDWAAIPQFLVRRTEDGGWALGGLAHGLIITIKLSLWAAAGALVWGLALALARYGRNEYLALMARTIIEGTRNLPPLVLIFIFYYFISGQIFAQLNLAGLAGGLTPSLKAVVEFVAAPVASLDTFLSAVLTLALYEGAYMAEIFRGGLASIPKGQWEASFCLGFNKAQQYRYVILPQAVRVVLPQLAGQFISTIKDSAIVMVISIEELTYASLQLMATIRQPIEVWLTAAALYFILNYSLSSFLKRFERN